MNRQMTQGTVANNVQVIPATKRRVSAGGQLKKAKDIRVAAYGRVSTDELAQQTSYEGQKSYYTKLINEKEGWTFAGMYADEAISGTNRNHRTEFNQMMQDALDGKIDYIITKSISRFARNTVDTLNCVRQLRQCDPPIGVYFEKENIDTLDHPFSIGTGREQFDLQEYQLEYSKAVSGRDCLWKSTVGLRLYGR